MSLPAPARGSIIRYSYLWADEDAAGREEGRKDRPVLVLATLVGEAKAQLLVLPITHTPVSDTRMGVPVPPEIRQRLGLDDMPGWIVTTEGNAFVWPGPDIRPIPNTRPRRILYGRVPNGLLQQVARSFLANRERQKSRLVSRSE